MAHKPTWQSVPDEPEPSHGDEQEQETANTDEYKRAIEEAFRINEAHLEAALQLAEANYAQLEHTKSQLRAIIDASQEAMLFLSPDGRPLKVNMRFTDFFGLDDTTVLSQSADQLTRSEEHTSELQSLAYLVCRLLLEKKKHGSRPASARDMYK